MSHPRIKLQPHVAQCAAHQFQPLVKGAKLTKKIFPKSSLIFQEKHKVIVKNAVKSSYVVYNIVTALIRVVFFKLGNFKRDGLQLSEFSS